MNKISVLICVFCVMQLDNRVATAAEALRLAGGDLECVLAAIKQFKSDQPKANLKRFMVDVNTRKDNVEITFVPIPRVGTKYYLGGGNEYGDEVHYLVSQHSLKVVRTTWAR